MNTTVEKLPGCKATMRVEFPAEDVAAEREKVVGEFMKHAKLPGFRSGKVPRKVVEKRFEEQIISEVRERLLRNGINESIEKEDLKVLQLTRVDEADFSDDGTFSFLAEMSLEPEISLPDYKGIEVKLPKVGVTEEHIDNAIERVRENVAEFEDVEGRAVEAGDFLTVDYKGSIDGSDISEAVPKAASYYAAGDGTGIEVSEEGFLPGFAMQLVGAEQGEKRTVQVKFPDEFEVFELQGIEAQYEVEVKEIKIRNLPEVDDEFSEKMFEGRKLADARELIRESLREQMDQKLDELKTGQILEFLHTQAEFDLPESSINDHAQRLIDQTVERGHMSGLSDEEIREHEEEIVGNANNQARIDIKTRFMLMEIAEKEELTVTQRELASQVSAIAQRNKVPPKKMAKQLKESGSLDGLKEQILAAKSLDFLKANASVVEVENEDTVQEQGSDDTPSESDTKQEE